MLFRSLDITEGYKEFLTTGYKKRGTLAITPKEAFEDVNMKELLFESPGGSIVTYSAAGALAGGAFGGLEGLGVAGKIAAGAGKIVAKTGPFARPISAVGGFVMEHPMAITGGVVAGVEGVNIRAAWVETEGEAPEKRAAVAETVGRDVTKILSFGIGFGKGRKAVKEASERVRAWDTAAEKIGFKEGYDKVPWRDRVKVFLGKEEQVFKRMGHGIEARLGANRGCHEAA